MRVGLTLIAGLDVLVKPLGGLRKWCNYMWFTLPHANHRDNQKYKRRNLEQRATQRTVGKSADQSKQGMNDQYGNVES